MIRLQNLMSSIIADFTWSEAAVALAICFVVYILIPGVILFFVVRAIVRRHRKKMSNGPKRTLPHP